MFAASNPYECPACGSTEFYGFSTLIETYRLTSDGPEVTETDGAGLVERIQCATCEVNLVVAAFLDEGRAVVKALDAV